MSKFKVGDRVVSLEKGYDAMEGWPNGEIVGLSDGFGFFDVRFSDSGGVCVHCSDTIVASQSPHYTPDASGKDYLARCEETYSRDEMIGAYRFTLGKYVDRMGKKQGEPVEKELDKIIDYATRAKRWLGRQS